MADMENFDKFILDALSTARAYADQRREDEIMLKTKQIESQLRGEEIKAGASKYSADQHLAGIKYNADSQFDLGQDKIAAENEMNKYRSDLSLEGVKYTSDNQAASARYNTDMLGKSYADSNFTNRLKVASSLFDQFTGNNVIADSRTEDGGFFSSGKKVDFFRPANPSEASSLVNDVTGVDFLPSGKKKTSPSLSLSPSSFSSQPTKAQDFPVSESSTFSPPQSSVPRNDLMFIDKTKSVFGSISDGVGNAVNELKKTRFDSDNSPYYKF